MMPETILETMPEVAPETEPKIKLKRKSKYNKKTILPVSHLAAENDFRLPSAHNMPLVEVLPNENEGDYFVSLTNMENKIFLSI